MISQVSFRMTETWRYLVTTVTFAIQYFIPNTRPVVSLHVILFALPYYAVFSKNYASFYTFSFVSLT